MSTPSENVPTEYELTLSELAERLLRDESEVLHDILLHLGAKTERIVRARLGTRLTEADSEDAMSIALYRLWIRRNRFDPSQARLDRWFYVLVRNAAIDVLRHRNRQQEEVLGDEADRVPQPAPPEDNVDTPLKRDLRRALQQMPEVDQRILLSGLSETELSRELDMKPGTIRVRRSRGKQRLRSVLRDMGHVF